MYGWKNVMTDPERPLAISNEVLGYPDPTVSEVIMNCTFQNVIALRGADRHLVGDLEPQQPGQGTPVAETVAETSIDEAELEILGLESVENGFILATGAVPDLPDGYRFTASVTTSGYRNRYMRVEPYHLQVNVTTPTGMVNMEALVPSRQFRNEIDRLRSDEELLPPRSSATLELAGQAREAHNIDVITDLGAAMPASGAPRYGHAYSALRRLLATADEIDWATGTHRLDTADMHAVIDFLVGFWGVVDLRTRYDDPQYLATSHSMPGDVVLPDPDPWPPRTPNHMPPIATRSAAAAGSAATAYAAHTYGHPVRPETLNASTSNFSARRALAGLWHRLRNGRKK
jgi:hypothetical protein